MPLPILALLVLLPTAWAATSITPGSQAVADRQSPGAPSIQPDALAVLVADAADLDSRERLLADAPAVSVDLVLRALLERGTRARIEAEPGPSERFFVAALELAEHRGLQTETARALEGLGTLAFELGKYPDARRLLDRALERAEAIARADLIASALNHRASVRFRQGELTAALADAKRALTMGEPLGSPALTAASLNAIGMVLRNQGHLDEAFAHYERALPLADSADDPVLLARILNNMGVAENVRGNHDRTLALYARSLQVSEAARFRWGIAQVLSNIGNIYVSLGDNARALDYLQRSEQESEAIGERRTAAFTLLMIGQVHRAQGRDDLALEFYERGRLRAEAIGERTFLSLATRYAGSVYLARREFALARKAFEDSLAIYQSIGNREGIGDAYQSLSALAEAEGDLDAALEFARTSLTLRDPVQDRRTWPMALTRLASLQLTRAEYADALVSAHQALETAVATGHPTRIWPAQLVAGRALRALGRREEARLMLDGAVATIESLREQTAGGEAELQRAFAGRVAPYHEISELLIEAGRTADALAYAERAKARALLDVLRSGRIHITRAMTPAEQQRERDLDATVATLTNRLERDRLAPAPDPADSGDLEARLAKARLDAEAFRIGLYAAHPELRVQRGEAQPITPGELEALAPDATTALLEYVVTRDQVFLFVVTRGTMPASPTVSVHRLGFTRETLAASVSRFRERLAARDLGFRAPARDLHAQLLGPALPQLGGRTNLVIVPDAALWDLPFAALIAPNGRYLLQDHFVSLVSSLTVWRELQQRRPASTGSALSVLALGNPVVAELTGGRAGLRAPNLAPLPAAEREVQRIASLYGPRRTETMVGSAAREDRLKQEAPKHSILHLATHGVLDNASPLYSHLVLAPGTSATGEVEDGRLSAREILDLTLQADLAVLSACETARGQLAEGEGMIGLTWALFIAGVPTTVVSQWRVDSDGTAELMVDFHRRLMGARAPASAAAALRASALALLSTARFRHPFYWAGFVTIGDGLRGPIRAGAVSAPSPRRSG